MSNDGATPIVERDEAVQCRNLSVMLLIPYNSDPKIKKKGLKSKAYEILE